MTNISNKASSFGFIFKSVVTVKCKISKDTVHFIMK